MQKFRQGLEPTLGKADDDDAVEAWFGSHVLTIVTSSTFLQPEKEGSVGVVAVQHYPWTNSCILSLENFLTVQLITFSYVPHVIMKLVEKFRKGSGCLLFL